MMWLIVGLGNIGSKYASTRHNAGFMALDWWMKSLNAPTWKTEHKAEVIKFKFENKNENQDVIIAKPQTFMNKSGESVQSLMSFYKIKPDQLLVLHDEIDLPFANLKFHRNRGAGGNNGIKSINELIGTQDYSRLKIGVGRPPHPDFQVADYVLSSFNKDEQDQLPKLFEKTSDAIEAYISQGLSIASTKFNGPLEVKKNETKKQELIIDTKTGQTKS